MLNNACYKVGGGIPITSYFYNQTVNIENSKTDDIKELLNYLNIGENDLVKGKLNHDKTHLFVKCIKCSEENIKGRLYQSKSENSDGCWHMYKRINYCQKCFENDSSLNVNDFNIIEAPKYVNNDFFTYDITFVRKINNNEYIYVLHEMNNDPDYTYVHYYLKYVKDHLVLIDWELDCYNPYFGCHVNLLEWDSENKSVLIGYHEKHKYCKAKIGVKEEEKAKGHKDYLSYVFERQQYEHSLEDDCEEEPPERQSLGEVLEFSVDGKNHKSKKYFDS
jgi:hypothetical protein